MTIFKVHRITKTAFTAVVIVGMIMLTLSAAHGEILARFQQ